MQPFTYLKATMAPLPLANIDTDQIIPKQFLKTVDRSGLGRGLFYDLRFDELGRERPDFVLNQAAFRNASVLVTGDNFGCGSSREHAPWALLDFGICCVISTGFADIFYNNCLQNGLLPIALDSSAVQFLTREASSGPNVVSVDLESQSLISPSGIIFRFTIDRLQKHRMLNGTDMIGETLTLETKIRAFEQGHETHLVDSSAASL